MKQNRRKLLINSRTKSIFTLFVVFSFIVAVVFLGWEIILQYLYANYYQVYESLYTHSNLGLVFKSILLIFWVGFTFFAAYFYVESKYNGIFARLDRMFNDVSLGHDRQLFFRDGDSFAHVGESFNRMLANMKTGNYVQQKENIRKIIDKIENLLQKQGAPRQELEEILKELKEFL